MRKVYLDANATTRVHHEVIDQMLPFYDKMYGNASSVHVFGREAKKHLERARQKIAVLINADSQEEIIFTSGGTESDNFAIKGTAYALSEKGNHIITSSVEHPAVLNTCKYLESQGFRVTYLEVDQYGIINLDELQSSITGDTILITIMAANNETGTLMPVNQIGREALRVGVRFHTDAVQFVGKIPFDVKRTGAELVSISAHKINGPKGIGALYVKKGTHLAPYQYGGHHEKGLRAGTENVPAIVGFGGACEIASRRGQEDYARIKKLRDILYDSLASQIDQIKLNGHPEKRLPNTVNIGFGHIESEAIILNLDLEGIAVSTGSACTSGNLEPSHVLKSMGIDPAFENGAVRFSLGIFNTQDEIDYTIRKLVSIINRLRQT